MVSPYAFLLISYIDPDMSYILFFQYALCHCQLPPGHDEAFLIPNYATFYGLLSYEIFLCFQDKFFSKSPEAILSSDTHVKPCWLLFQKTLKLKNGSWGLLNKVILDLENLQANLLINDSEIQLRNYFTFNLDFIFIKFPV